MRTGLLFFLVLFASLLKAQAQAKCDMPGEGTYYYYPRNGGTHLKYVNKGDRQIEYNLDNGDSAVYKIAYNKDYYTLKYVSGYASKTKEERDLLKKLTLAYEVVGCGTDYLVFKGHLDKSAISTTEDRHTIIDTLWRSEQSRPKVRERFQVLTESLSFLRRHFKDTSAYSIVYLYRPSKFFAMGNEYYVQANSMLVFWAQNNTRIAYKVYGKDPVLFTARSGKVDSKITINPEPGKKYYLQCIIHHRLSKATPELKLVEAAEGQLEYDRTGQ